MSHIRDTRRRTPTGFLYPYPKEPQTLQAIGSNWLAGGALELGGIHLLGDENEARFSRYADWSQSFLLHSFDLVLLEEKAGVLAELRGTGVGRNDQVLGAEIDWLGRVRLRFEHSGLPRSEAKDARTLYRNLGGNTLRLQPGLTPGDNADPVLVAALAGQGSRNLSFQRDETRLQLDLWARGDTRLYAGFEQQDRNGERPYGGSWLYGTGLGPARAVELVTPADDQTYAAHAGVELQREALQVSAGYRGSFYRNAHDHLTFDNPFLLSGFTSPAQVRRGRLALAPDNDSHNLHVDVGAMLPYAGRLVLAASWTRMIQDERLLPPTLNEGSIGSLDLDQWNTRAALPRDSANARVDTLLLSGDLGFRPWQRIRLGTRVRYFERASETHYTARNPVTDEYGYVTEDGALAAAFPNLTRQVPIANPRALEDFRFRSTPYGYDQLEIQGRADATLPRHTRFRARYAWMRKGYDGRERSSTRENRAELAVSSRVQKSGTVRLSYRWADRKGEEYDSDPYDRYFISGLPGAAPEKAFTLAQLRKYDIADRESHEAELRWNLLLRDDMDLGLSARFRVDEYGADYGLTVERAASIAADWIYAPSQHLSLQLMGSWERLERNQQNINDTRNGGGGLDPNAGGLLYPLTNRWELDSEQDSFFAGADLSWRVLDRLSIEVDYRLIYTRQQLDYDFAGQGALAGAVVEAGSRFPELESLDHVLDASVRVALDEHVAIRIFHRFQRGELDDFQQRGLADPALVGGTAGSGAGVLFLGHRDRDYSAHVLGATLQLRFF